MEVVVDPAAVPENPPRVVHGDERAAVVALAPAIGE
jgi:hypothetical protein